MSQATPGGFREALSRLRRHSIARLGAIAIVFLFVVAVFVFGTSVPSPRHLGAAFGFGWSFLTFFRLWLVLVNQSCFVGSGRWAEFTLG